MFFFDLAPANSVDVWAGLISQSGTGAPTDTVVKNDFGGPIVWARVLSGFYSGTLAGAFPDGKTIFLKSAAGVSITRQDDNTILISTSGDDVLSNMSLKIERYP